MSTQFENNDDLVQKAQKIKLLILDVDGVMTDGTIGYIDNGGEVKYFDAKDGVGIKYLVRAGLRAGIITGRSSPVVTRRAEELDISFVSMNAKDKTPAFEKMLADAAVTEDEVAVVGDDLPDIPLIRRAGLGIAVADAVFETRQAADWVTGKNGGKGAIREVIEMILKAQNRWDTILSRYIS